MELSLLDIYDLERWMVGDELPYMRVCASQWEAPYTGRNYIPPDRAHVW